MMAFDHRAIDDVIHGSVRLDIMAFLKGARQADFVELRTALGVTDGNLAMQLRKLEEHGYVRLDKGHLGRRTRMTVTLTESGDAAMTLYLERLKTLFSDG
jgi:DNA-binding MarR family transcriptional regulator